MNSPPNSCAALSLSESQTMLKNLCQNWRISLDGYLCKEFTFKNFVEPVNLANRVADIAEEINHHPRITISWGKCLVEIWTHDLQKLQQNKNSQKIYLTAKDFLLAQKIDNHYR